MFTMEKLPYAYKSLEPYIDAATMELHYDKHYRSYTDQLNRVAQAHPEFFGEKSIEEILRSPEAVPQEFRRQTLDFGGGFANHSLLWKCFSPNGGGEPFGPLKGRMRLDFGTFEAFKQQFSQAAMSVFGSGWAWLAVDRDRELVIATTQNQDTPLSRGLQPLLLVDVWEHAYYFKYQNRRADYLEAVFHVIDWDEVEKRYLKAIRS